MSSLKVQTRLSAKYLALAHQKLVEAGYGSPATNSELVRVMFMTGLQFMAGNLNQAPRQEYLDKYKNCQSSSKQGRSIADFLSTLSGTSPESAESQMDVPIHLLPSALQDKCSNLIASIQQGYSDPYKDMWRTDMVGMLSAFILAHNGWTVTTEESHQIEKLLEKLKEEQNND